MWNPRIAHYLSLPFSLAVILIVARNQWFFGDDWAILVPRLDGQVFAPHVGHWDLIPALVFPALRNLVGLGSYTPYLLLAILVHLSVAHLVWRVLNRIGVAPWTATLATLLVMLLGAGAENILWAFQFGYMGAIALGLAVLLLLDSSALGPGRILGIVALSTLAPMFSGTALPVLAAAAVVGLVRHGWWRTALLFLPTAATYLTWYVIFDVVGAGGASPVWTPSGVLFALAYALAIIGAGLGRALPWIGLGVIPAVAIPVWFVKTVRRNFRGTELAAYALAFGAVAFAILTAYARSEDGITSAAAQRYAYVVIVLFLPALCLMVQWLTARRRRLAVASMVALAAIVLFNLGTLEVSGEQQARREATSRARIDAVYELILHDRESASTLSRPADFEWSPDLRGSDIVSLIERGQFRP